MTVAGDESYRRALEDPNRLKCPNGHSHSSWARRSTYGSGSRGPDARSEFYCSQCLDNGDDPHFDDPVDVKDLESSRPETYPF